MKTSITVPLCTKGWFFVSTTRTIRRFKFIAHVVATYTFVFSRTLPCARVALIYAYLAKGNIILVNNVNVVRLYVAIIPNRTKVCTLVSTIVAVRRVIIIANKIAADHFVAVRALPQACSAFLFADAAITCVVVRNHCIVTAVGFMAVYTFPNITKCRIFVGTAIAICRLKVVTHVVATDLNFFSRTLPQPSIAFFFTRDRLKHFRP